VLRPDRRARAHTKLAQPAARCPAPNATPSRWPARAQQRSISSVVLYDVLLLHPDPMAPAPEAARHSARLAFRQSVAARRRSTAAGPRTRGCLRPLCVSCGLLQSLLSLALWPLQRYCPGQFECVPTDAHIPAKSLLPVFQFPSRSRSCSRRSVWSDAVPFEAASHFSQAIVCRGDKRVRGRLLSVIAFPYTFIAVVTEASRISSGWTVRSAPVPSIQER